MMLEGYAINFLHGWNYVLMKTDIDVMMLFKFDIKWVNLNFKAIALMELEWRLRVFPSASIFVFEIHRFKVCSLILEFWNLHSACYRLWMK